MRLLEKLDNIKDKSGPAQPEKVLTHRLGDDLRRLAACRSTRELERSTLYQVLAPDIEALTHGYEYGCFAEPYKTTKPFYRAICWNLEGGVNFKGILETLRNRAFVNRADIYFFPQTDVGMARSGNRNVIRDLAIELGYNYFFAVSYLHLNQPAGGQPNQLALEGNALMSRLPLSNLRVIGLRNFADPVKPAIKRVGCQKALLADLILPDKSKLTLVLIHLPLASSPSGRARLIKHVLRKIERERTGRPVLIGGDFKTSTYNLKSRGWFFLSVLNKRYRDLDYIIQEHHTHPEKHFERKLFRQLITHGLSYEPLNELGKGNYHTQPQGLAGDFNEKRRLDRLLIRTLKSTDGLLTFKYSWFAANDLVCASPSHQAERPRVISHLFYEGRPVSAHDPILLDFEIQKNK